MVCLNVKVSKATLDTHKHKHAHVHTLCNNFREIGRLIFEIYVCF